jgi:hypothetical protein
MHSMAFRSSYKIKRDVKGKHGGAAWTLLKSDARKSKTALHSTVVINYLRLTHRCLPGGIKLMCLFFP